MMDYVKSLVDRGLISKEAAEGFAKRLQSLNKDMQGEIEDRRNDPKNPYLSMMATNRRIIDPWLKLIGPWAEFGPPVKPQSSQPVSQMQKDAGYLDIPN